MINPRISTEIYGYSPWNLITDKVEAEQRLVSILSDKVMRFNPYSVDDTTLFDCAMRGRWRGWPSLTQMVILNFKDISHNRNLSEDLLIHYNIGNDPAELTMSAYALFSNMTYEATRNRIRSTINGRRITNPDMIRRMAHQSFFVSHTLDCNDIKGAKRVVYRIHRLNGNVTHKADVIRKSMCEAKLIMLKEILNYPYCRSYLNCPRNLFNYTTPVMSAIKTIRSYSSNA